MQEIKILGYIKDNVQQNNISVLGTIDNNIISFNYMKDSISVDLINNIIIVTSSERVLTIDYKNISINYYSCLLDSNMNLKMNLILKKNVNNYLFLEYNIEESKEKHIFCLQYFLK